MPTGQGPLAFCSGGDQAVRGEGGYVGEDSVPRLNVLDLQACALSAPPFSLSSRCPAVQPVIAQRLHRWRAPEDVLPDNLRMSCQTTASRT